MNFIDFSYSIFSDAKEIDIANRILNPVNITESYGIIKERFVK